MNDDVREDLKRRHGCGAQLILSAGLRSGTAIKKQMAQLFIQMRSRAWAE
jgi:hypothetical protein